MLRHPDPRRSGGHVPLSPPTGTVVRGRSTGSSTPLQYPTSSILVPWLLSLVFMLVTVREGRWMTPPQTWGKLKGAKERSWNHSSFSVCPCVRVVPVLRALSCSDLRDRSGGECDTGKWTVRRSAGTCRKHEDSPASRKPPVGAVPRSRREDRDPDLLRGPPSSGLLSDPSNRHRPGGSPRVLQSVRPGLRLRGGDSKPVRTPRVCGAEPRGPGT